MTVKEHYDRHLGNFYSWMTGDFVKNKDEFKSYCLANKIEPLGKGYAIDLGAGNGIQTVALAELGYTVKAIDFNSQLIDELKSNVKVFSVEVIFDDIRLIDRYSEPKPELIICCGDTISHLQNLSEIDKLIGDSFSALVPRGKIILSFRDYSSELVDVQRFIPVKSDEKRILTCFLEYFRDKLRVTDLLYELEDGKWVQKVSSYFKIRITNDKIMNILVSQGFKIIGTEVKKGMIYIIAEKI
jgi:SAM-dependent methyltransferase